VHTAFSGVVLTDRVAVQPRPQQAKPTRMDWEIKDALVGRRQKVGETRRTWIVGGSGRFCTMAEVVNVVMSPVMFGLYRWALDGKVGGGGFLPGKFGGFFLSVKVVKFILRVN